MRQITRSVRKMPASRPGKKPVRMAMAGNALHLALGRAVIEVELVALAAGSVVCELDVVGFAGALELGPVVGLEVGEEVNEEVAGACA